MINFNFRKIFALLSLCIAASMAMAEGETWTSIGKGLFRDDCFTTPFIIKNSEYDVEVEECDQKPGLYRLENPYRNHPLNSQKEPSFKTYMLIDAQNPKKVYIPEMYDTQFVPYGADASYVIFSKSGYGILSEDMSEVNANYGKEVDGVITFPKGALLISNMPSGVEGKEWDRIYQGCNKSGKFRIVLPTTKRLDCEITLGDGKVENGDKFDVSMSIAIGSDCEQLKVAMFEGAFSNDMVAKVKTAEAGKDGVVDVKTFTEKGQTVKVNFPVEKNGVYTFVGVPYFDGNPNELRSCYVQYELDYYLGDWKSLGFGQYTEGILSNNEVSDNNKWPLENVTYEVEIQENEAKVGLFRIVNPYGLAYRYASESNYDQSRNYYLIIDASRYHRAVVKKMDDSGLEYGGYNFGIWSNADRFMEEQLWSEDEVLAKFDWFGIRNGNEITFPNDALCIKFSAVPTWYYANTKGQFKVVLPAGASEPPINVAVEDVEDDEFNGTTEYFTLQGVKVAEENLQQGSIYIVRRGTKVTKEYFNLR